MLHIVASGEADLPASRARAALVSVVMGQTYTTAWKHLSAGSWIAYAERWGFDIVIITDRIDPSDTERSPAWQKLMILNCPWSKRYERIVWIDSDVVISDTAPNILDHAGPPEKISLCVDAGRISPVEGQVYIERSLRLKLRPSGFDTAWPRAQHEFYVSNGVAPHDVIFNTGVMALSPVHHNDLLLEVYQCPQLTGLYEQAHLSHRLLERDLAHVLSPRFNWGFIEQVQLFVNSGLRGDEDEQFIGEVTHVLLRAELRKAYFLHFYGAMQLMMNYANLPAFQSAAAAA